MLETNKTARISSERRVRQARIFTTDDPQISLFTVEFRDATV